MVCVAPALCNTASWRVRSELYCNAGQPFEALFDDGTPFRSPFDVTASLGVLAWLGHCSKIRSVPRLWLLN